MSLLLFFFPPKGQPFKGVVDLLLWVKHSNCIEILNIT